MAGMSSELSINSPLSFDFPDGLVDDDVAQRMIIPQKITVSGDEEEQPSVTRSGDIMTSSMSIPERIEIGNVASPTSEIPRDLRDHLVNGNSMGGMTTPPRTLTVDDTKSAHYPQRMAAGQSSRVRESGESADPRSRTANVAKFMDDERYLGKPFLSFHSSYCRSRISMYMLLSPLILCE